MDVISSQLYLARSASFYTLCTLVWKRCREWALYIYLHFYIISTLFAYFLVCHPYIFFYFYFLSKIGLGGINLSLHVPILIDNRVVTMSIVWLYYLCYITKEILIPLAILSPCSHAVSVGVSRNTTPPCAMHVNHTYFIGCPAAEEVRHSWTLLAEVTLIDFRISTD